MQVKLLLVTYLNCQIACSFYRNERMSDFWTFQFFSKPNPNRISVFCTHIPTFQVCGVLVKWASDLWLRGRGFDSRQEHDIHCVLAAKGNHTNTIMHTVSKQ